MHDPSSLDSVGPSPDSGLAAGTEGAPDASEAERTAAAVTRYWRRNMWVMAALLLVWAAAGLGAGVLFADTLSGYRIGGYPLGFWFAQQGSILVFVLLILVYAVVMNRLDRRHHEELDAARATASPAGGEAPR